MGWLSSRESSLRHGSSHSEARGRQVKRTRASYSRARCMDVAREGLSVEGRCDNERDCTSGAEQSTEWRRCVCVSWCVCRGEQKRERYSFWFVFLVSWWLGWWGLG